MLPTPARSRARRPARRLPRQVDWKLTRGKTRPKLLDYAKQADGAAVEAATTEAFKLLLGGGSGSGSGAGGGKGGAAPAAQQATAGLKRLCELKGIGPATASAMAALVQPSLPFMSDEALSAVLGGRESYTLPQYMRLAEAMQAKAGELSGQGQRQWTPVELERCLWVEAQRGKQQPGGAKGGGGAGGGTKRGAAAAGGAGKGATGGKRQKK